MNTDNGSLKFEIELINSRLRSQVAEAKAQFRELSSSVQSDSMDMDAVVGKSMDSIKRNIVSLGATWAMQEFARKIATVRGEFQQLEVAMETMLGSASKAQELMSQMVETAAKTPLGLKEVGTGAKQLLAYGLEAEKVNETLIRLGDIATGLSIPLSDMVYLYGTTMVQGRLYTQDLNQFLNRGIPLVKELAAQFKVAEKDVKGLVEDGKVGFPEVQKAIENLTNAGGKFGGLMEKQSHTISGQISNIEDAFDVMLNEIGQQNEGVINSALEATSWLVEHYEATADALMTLVATYGVYKASLMAMCAFTNAAYSYEATQLKALLVDKQAAIDADLAEAVTKGRLTSSRAMEVQTLRAELQAKLELAKAEAVQAEADARAATRKRMLAQLAYNKAKAEVEAKQEEIEACESCNFLETAETLQKEKDTLVTKMHAAQEELDAAAKLENAAKTRAATTAQVANTLATKKDELAKKMNVRTTKLLTLAQQGLAKALDAVKKAWSTNPIGLILTGLTLAAGALITYNDAQDSASIESHKFGEAAAKTVRDLETLFHVVEFASKKSRVHEDAIDDICKIYEEYGIHIDNEKDKLSQLNAEREKVIELIKKEGEIRDQANNIAAYDEAIEKKTEAMKKKLLEALQEAEIDGSGLIDDWDDNGVREKAEELAVIISRIYESEAKGLAEMAGKPYMDQVDEYVAVLKKAEAAFDGIVGVDSDWAVYDALGKTRFDRLDVDFSGILHDYVDSVGKLTKAKEELAEKYAESAKAEKEEAEAVDYTKMSFDELFGSANQALDVIVGVGKQKPKPTIDTTSIAEAVIGVNTLTNNLKKLCGIDLKIEMPEVVKKYIDLLTQYNNKQKEIDSNEQEEIAKELQARIDTALETRKGTADLLKEVNSCLETAKKGSKEEKALLVMQKQLLDGQATFEDNKRKKKNDTGETAAQRLAKIKKAENEVTALMTKAATDRKQLLTDIEFQIQDNQVKLIREGGKRKAAQMALNHAKELEDLQRREKDQIEAEITRQKKIFDAREDAKATADKKYAKRNFNEETDVDQTEVNKIIEKYKILYEQLRLLQQKDTEDVKRQEEDAQNQYLREFGDYAKRRAAILALAKRQMEAAETEGDRMKIRVQAEIDTSNLDLEAWKSSGPLAQAFGDISELSRETIQKLITDMEKARGKFTEAFDPKALQEFNAAMKALNDADFELSMSEGLSEIAPKMVEVLKLQRQINLEAANANALATQKESLEAQLTNLTMETDPVTREQKQRILSKEEVIQVEMLRQQIANISLELENSANRTKNLNARLQEMKKIKFADFKNLSNQLVTAGKHAADFAKMFDDDVANSIAKGTEALSGMVDAVDTIQKSFNALIKSTEKVVNTTVNAAEKTVDAAGQGMKATAASTATSMSTMEKASAILAIIGAAIQLATIIVGLFNNDAKKEKEIERLQKKIDLLEESYSNLDRAIDKAYSKSAAGLINEQNTLLRQQQQLIRNQIEQEKSKKGGGDEDRIADWEKQIRDIENTIADNKEAMVDAIFGEDVKSAISNFADAYASMFDEGISKARASKNLVRDMIKKMITEAMKSDLSAPMGRVREMLNSYFVDGVISDGEEKAVEGYVKGVMEEQAAKWGWADKYLKEANGQDGGTRGGFTAMSQDSADELNGRFTAIQMDSAAMRLDVAASRATLENINTMLLPAGVNIAQTKQYVDEIRGMSLIAIDHLESISKNTHELFQMNERLGKIEKYTSRL